MSSGSIGASQRRWFPNGGTERQHATTAHKILCHYFHTTIDLTTHKHIREWRQNYLYRQQPKHHSKEILHFDGQFLELEGVFLSVTNVFDKCDVLFRFIT